MATPVVMPKLGNSVESTIIVAWKKKIGDAVRAGDVLCEVETDKSVMEVAAPADGVLIARYFNEGDDVPVMTEIGLLGAAGEAAITPQAPNKQPQPAIAPPETRPVAVQPVVAGDRTMNGAASPRARTLAAQHGIDPARLSGSGPAGRIIERDIQAVIAHTPPLTPLAKASASASNRPLPAYGSGLGGRITAADLNALPAIAPINVDQTIDQTDDAYTAIPLKGVRKVIAERMVASLHSGAQLTLNSSADARALLDFRKRLKASDESLGLRDISINDLILFAVARTLPAHPALNSTLSDGEIRQYRAVHLGFAVDTPRGLLVPIVRGADRLSLRSLAAQVRDAAQHAQTGSAPPDLLSGGTFTVTNLGSLGIESFTPIINPPQVAILGVGNINLKPIEIDGAVQFIPHIGLSLTVDHQAVDGAPGARFLATLCKNLAVIDLLMAL